MFENEFKVRERPVIAICPGHGGIDPGAVHGDVTEAQITFKYAFELNTALQVLFLLNSKLLFTTTESYFRKSNKEKFLLSERIERTQDVGADIFISIHVNSVDNPQAHGSEVWIHRADEKNDLEIAQILSKALSSKEMKDRGVKYTGKYTGEHGLYVLRKTLDIPSVLLEIGFLSNNANRAYMMNDKTRQEQIGRVSTALAQYVQKYYDYEMPGWVIRDV